MATAQGWRVLPHEGPPIDSGTEALAAVTAMAGEDVEWVCIPKQRLASDFFRLRTGLAGDIAQKFVNYGLKVAILGEFGEEISASGAFRDFVRECNRGTQLWFLAGEADLAERLGERT